MSRLDLSSIEEEEVKVVNAGVEDEDLDVLIPKYAEDKKAMGVIKKRCDGYNETIKERMVAVGTDEYSAGSYTAKRIVVEKETLNEERLMEVLKAHNIEGIIKTREYVDMDALESYLYNNQENLSEELASEMNNCRIVNEVVQLRISKRKETK